MMFKFVALLSFVCLTRAGLLENEAYASPEISYVAPAIGGISHGAASPALSAITQANYADSTPAVSYADSAINYAAPAVSYAAPAVAYSSPVIGAAPVSTYAAPVAYTAPIAKAYVAENYAPAHYDFGYAVNDPHTGDSKSHEESRRGDVVQGRYSLIDSDGTKRTVEYSADAHNGFNAVVHKEPIGHAGPVVKIAAPVAYSPAVAPTYYH